MTAALTIIFSFLFGAIFGGGVLWFALRWMLQSNDYVIDVLTRFIAARPGMLEILQVRVASQLEDELRLVGKLQNLKEDLRKRP